MGFTVGMGDGLWVLHGCGILIVCGVHHGIERLYVEFTWVWEIVCGVYLDVGDCMWSLPGCGRFYVEFTCMLEIVCGVYLGVGDCMWSLHWCG